MDATVDNCTGPYRQAPIAHGQHTQQGQRGMVVHVEESKGFLAQNQEQRINKVVVLAEIEYVAPEKQRARIL